MDWVLNFDGILNELVILLVCLFNLLFNGMMGIVVGMVIDVLSHNLCEVVVIWKCCCPNWVRVLWIGY